MNQKKINKNDYYFIHEKEKNLENDFLIKIPQLKPKDIVLLYMQFNSKNESVISEGPILKQIRYERIIDVLISEKYNILNDNYGKKSALRTATEIIYTLCKNTFHIYDDLDEFEQNIDEKLKKLIDESEDKENGKPENKQKIKDFVGIFTMTLDIARKIDELN